MSANNNSNDDIGNGTSKLNDTTEISALIENLEKLMNPSTNYQNPNSTAE